MVIKIKFDMQAADFIFDICAQLEHIPTFTEEFST
jgi:hypothetical protein